MERRQIDRASNVVANRQIAADAPVTILSIVAEMTDAVQASAGREPDDPRMDADPHASRPLNSARPKPLAQLSTRRHAGRPDKTPARWRTVMSSAIRLIGPFCNRCEGVVRKGPFLKKRKCPAAPRQAGSTFSMRGHCAMRTSLLSVRPLQADRDARGESAVRRETTSAASTSRAPTGTAVRRRAESWRAL